MWINKYHQEEHQAFVRNQLILSDFTILRAHLGVILIGLEALLYIWKCFLTETSCLTNFQKSLLKSRESLEVIIGKCDFSKIHFLFQNTIKTLIWFISKHQVILFKSALNENNTNKSTINQKYLTKIAPKQNLIACV